MARSLLPLLFLPLAKTATARLFLEIIFLVFFSGGLLWYCHVKRNTIDLQYPEPLLGKKSGETKSWLSTLNHEIYLQQLYFRLYFRLYIRQFTFDHFHLKYSCFCFRRIWDPLIWNSELSWEIFSRNPFLGPIIGGRPL